MLNKRHCSRKEPGRHYAPTSASLVGGRRREKEKGRRAGPHCSKQIFSRSPRRLYLPRLLSLCLPSLWLFPDDAVELFFAPCFLPYTLSSRALRYTHSSFSRFFLLLLLFFLRTTCSAFVADGGCNAPFASRLSFSRLNLLLRSEECSNFLGRLLIKFCFCAIDKQENRKL